MATVQSYKTRAGIRRFVALVRITGFRSASKAFATKRGATEWAEQYERELRAERDRGGAQAEAGDLTIRLLVERFLASPRTKQLSYFPDLERLLAEWVAEFGDIKVRSFGKYQITKFRDDRAKDIRPATVNRYLSAMRRCWNWGAEEGYVLSASAWPKKVMLKEPGAREVIASAAELLELFEACDAVELGLGALARFLVGTGARLSDALAVTWRDVDLKSEDVALRGQKTKRPLRVAMLAPALDGLRQAAKLKHVSGRVFWQYDDRAGPRTAWLKARKGFPEHLREARLHDCRHMCASILAASGATDVELAAQLGHSTLAMVKRYSHLRGGHRGTGHQRVDEAFGKVPREGRPA